MGNIYTCTTAGRFRQQPPRIPTPGHSWPVVTPSPLGWARQSDLLQITGSSKSEQLDANSWFSYKRLWLRLPSRLCCCLGSYTLIKWVTSHYRGPWGKVLPVAWGELKEQRGTKVFNPEFSPGGTDFRQPCEWAWKWTFPQESLQMRPSLDSSLWENLTPWFQPVGDPEAQKLAKPCLDSQTTETVR